MTSYRAPELLTRSYDVTSFDCDDEALDHRPRQRAAHNQREGSSRIWVATGLGGRVVAYYASSTAALVRRTSPTKRAARNQPNPLPAMLLGRLALDRQHQGRGLAAALLKHFLLKALEVAALTGLRIDPEEPAESAGLLASGVSSS